jgi:hypothetical protein
MGVGMSVYAGDRSQSPKKAFNGMWTGQIPLGLDCVFLVLSSPLFIISLPFVTTNGIVKELQMQILSILLTDAVRLWQ